MVVPGGARLAVLAGVIGAVGALSPPARGQLSAGDRSFSLEYRAPQGCPAAAALSEAIKARSAQATAVEPAVASVHLTVEILPSGHSSLWVDLPEGSFRREFQAVTCVEAVESVALMAAMVLDAAPEARRAMTQLSAEAPAPSAEVAPPTETPSEPVEPAPEPLPVASPVPARAEQRAPVPRKPPASSFVWRAAAGAGFETAVAPSPPVGGSFGLEGWLRRASIWSPSLRVGLFATTTATQQATAGDGKFRLLTSQLRLCPMRWSPGKAFRLLPCAQAEAGALTASGGGGPVNTQEKSMPWIAFGASLRAELDLLGPLALEGGADAKGLARRDSFVFRTFNSTGQGPDSLVYQVPTASFGFGLGLLLRLP
jgi:hypothetical protein